MLTRPNGYPLDSWGSDGYGIGCADVACLDRTISELAARGVRVVKIALDDNGLDEALVPHAVEVAHAKGFKVAVHALSDRSALVAARANADVLAHTPVEPLSDETIAAWKSRAVISTLAAFGGSDAAVANLAKLRTSGATVLYGTDLGNLRDAGPSAAEFVAAEARRRRRCCDRRRDDVDTRAVLGPDVSRGHGSRARSRSAHRRVRTPHTARGLRARPAHVGSCRRDRGAGSSF
jgi:hypothetical protein